MNEKNSTEPPLTVESRKWVNFDQAAPLKQCPNLWMTDLGANQIGAALMQEQLRMVFPMVWDCSLSLAA